MPRCAPSDTIAAIATAPGEGAVAIVRLSGPDAYPLADRLFRCAGPAPSGRPAGTFVHGCVLAPRTQETIDDALLLLFRAPHSYTGEDSVEFQCHGGVQPARRILEALLELGARQAEPGEFSRRAFLNGKMDLTQAEAVLDLIHARSERAARMAAAQLENALGLRIRALYDDLVAIAADVEAMLDFPDDELPQSIPLDIVGRMETALSSIGSLLETWHEGHLLREGALVAIVGPPNVGKSTLLNRLAGRSRAIVSDQPGTTRDTIEESVALRGYPLRLVDTAGLREAPCEIEREGIRRTRRVLADADLCLCVLDASQPLSAADRGLLDSLNPKNTLVFLNKTDLGTQTGPDAVPFFDSLPVSLRNDADLGRLADKIVEKMVQNPSGSGQETVAISERHKKLLLVALDEVKSSKIGMETEREAHFLLSATHLRAAVDAVGAIFGKNCTEDMLDAVFSRFCVGK